eukprot:TRINITY_DN26_c0_g1_i1.p1 TRINITY_DN26_c0_g1~~TRINITY_DN26_c0_g1_i1.p1  ORF type:complete len:1067 (+),score=443.10 TRINITY_DN26_c0_g1_i1:82-3282(+)
MSSSHKVLEEAVRKSTKNKPVPPKRKHVRTIVLETHNEGGGNSFFNEAFKRHTQEHDVVAWKVLVVSHHAMSEGHRRVLDDAVYRNTTFEAMKHFYGRPGLHGAKTYHELIGHYSTFLLDKIKFHQTHPEFTGDFNMDAFQKHPDSKDINKNLNAVTHMMELQASICRMGIKLFDMKDMVDCKTSCLIPLVIESYNIYTITTYLLRILVSEMDNMDLLTFMIEQFYAQYITLKNFFYDCSGVKYVTSVIAVPTLPNDPPEFFGSRRVSKTTKKPEPEPAPKPAPAPAPAPVVAQPVYQPQPVYVPPPQQPVNYFDAQPNPFNTNNNPFGPAPTANPFAGAAASTNWVTFGNTAPFTSTAVVPPQPLAPAPFQNRTVGGLGDLVSLVKTQTQSDIERKRTDTDAKRREEEERRRKEAERKQKEEEEARARKAKEDEELRRRREEERRREEAKRKAEEAKRREEEEVKRRDAEKIRHEEERKRRELERKQAEEERIRKIALEESSNEIKELKMRIVELERLLAAEKEKNKQNEDTISDLQATIEALKRQVAREKEELQEQTRDASAEKDKLIAKMKEDYDQLQLKMNNFIREAQEEKNSVFRADIGAAMNAINSFLSKLDSPTNLGNETASAMDVIEDSEKMEAATSSLLMACSSGSSQAVSRALKEFAASGSTLFDDAKGYSRRVEDSAMRSKLLDSVRGTGNVLGRLLSTVDSIGGVAKDENDRNALNTDSAEVVKKLKDLTTAAHESEQIPDDSGVDLEELAERELLEAARVIEAAAASLLASKAAPKPENFVANGVADAILEAAMAITKATSLLVAAAAAAQKERVDKGKALPPGVVYKRDPRWSQGLISAAKSVANATQMMISTANDVVHGKIDEENVIAASKAVAASTAQLVAATKAKADDPNSPAQVKIGSASKAVTVATTQLVEAVRAASLRNEETYDDSVFNPTQRKIKEMELQTHILKLEKELGSVRNRLFGLRKAEYTGAPSSLELQQSGSQQGRTRGPSSADQTTQPQQGRPRAPSAADQTKGAALPPPVALPPTLVQTTTTTRTTTAPSNPNPFL